MRLRSLVLLLVASLSCPVTWSDAAVATPAKCTDAIATASARFVQDRALSLQSCETKKLAGKLDRATACATEPKATARLAKARAKLTKAIAGACGGGDRLCGGANAADDVDLGAIGWNVGTCPAFAPDSCAIAIASCADISACLACVNEAAAAQATGLYNGALQPTDPKDKTVKALRRCQATIGKSTTAFLASRTQALATCWHAASRAGSGGCPDARATATITKARAKQAKSLQRACAGPDKAFATADDLTPAAIGFPSTCPDVATVGGSTCGGAVDGLAQLIDCVACVTEFDVDCADRAAVPSFVSPYPPECTVTPTPVTTTTTTFPPLPECTAQRTVHIIGGNGGLAWFTIVWPLPAVIAANSATYSYDDVTLAAQVPGTEAGHPLYARRIGARTLFDGTGTQPQPSVFVAGANQTHTGSPDVTSVGSVEIIAAGAALQGDLQAPVAVIKIGSGQYGPAPDAPLAAAVADVEGAISAIDDVTPLSSEVEASLRPTIAALATWGVDGSTPVILANLARNLLFAANAFRLGMVSTVVIQAMNDDPHGAFADIGGTLKPRADALTKILDSFYAELSAHSETTCGHANGPLSLADNVVLVVSGDTFKDPFNRSGWGDGTPGSANLLYVRSNGYLKPGWFGALTPGTRTVFDPDTGALTALGAPAATTAARLGVLFAISRGNTEAVTAVSPSAYGGLVASPLP
ncbi:MAG TPA: hypothetical protein VGR62_15055 [Candidatus Binatia bacterium]|jgi:hypothetical protein|nr:hypothetical protein [Candidatus Binatia bacterium]